MHSKHIGLVIPFQKRGGMSRLEYLRPTTYEALTTLIENEKNNYYGNGGNS